MSLTITIPGAVNVTTGSTAPAVLTIGVGVPGAQGPQGPAGQGVPAGGTAGQFLTKIDGTNYNTDWTTVNLSVYAVKANNLSDLTSASTARSNLGLGTMATASAADYSTTTVANGLYYPLTGNPSSFLTASALTGYATQSFVAANYAPIAAGLPTGGTVGQVLTKNSGTDYDDSWQTLIPGDRYVTTSTTSNTIGNGAKTFTVGTGLSYSSQQDVVISYDASNHMHAVVTSYNSGTGVMVVDVRSHTGAGTYSSWTVNVGGTTPLQTVEWGEILGVLGDQTDLATALNAKLETSTAASTYAALAGATFTGEVITPASTTSNAGLTITPGVAPSAPVNGEIWATTNDLQVRLNGVTETIAEQSWVTAQGYLTSAPVTSVAGRTGAITLAVGDVSGAAALAGATFTGLVNTVASATTGAGFRLPHGAAPTTPLDGDVWTTTGNLWVRINGASQAVALQGSSAQLSSNNIFTNASSTYGNSTAAGTINLGTGATISGATKAINIGTGGVAGSTTNITLGTNSGGGATITLQNNTTVNANLTTTGTASSISNSTATQTLSLATGATINGSTKTVNIGTGGVSGSTTNITIGTNSGGTSNTTLVGNTTGVTAAADTNSTALATTAYVVGQAGSATPLVDGTAAVGTSLRYARQDHVHPTDTSRAALASPTFTGTPAAPTAAADTNTTQLATTAFVVAQAGSATPLVDGTAAVGTSLRYARQDHVHPTDTTRAPLASPTFTGTVTIPAGASITGYATTASLSTYAPLASPALTGTPTAPTATAGTNTTQIATTAFVTAAVPAIATVAQTNSPSSNTLAMSPDKVRQMIMFPGFQQFLGGGSTGTSGTGAVAPSTANRWRQFIGPNTATAGYSAFVFDLLNSNIGFVGSKRGSNEYGKNYARALWMSGRTIVGTDDGGFGGDANTLYRCELGGRNNIATNGDPDRASLGWRVAGGGSQAIVFYMRSRTTLNGGTYAETTTSFSPVYNQWFDWMVTYNGTDTCQMYVNDTLVGTISANFTGFQGESFNYYSERIEQTASAATRLEINTLPSRIFFSE